MRRSLALLALTLVLPSLAADFDPRAYPLHTARCPALPSHSPATNTSSDTDTVALRYADINPTSPHTLLLVHGWPSLWASWKFQIPVLVDAGYRLIVPELRGFGESDAGPQLDLYVNEESGEYGGVPAPTTFDLVDDLECILHTALSPTTPSAAAAAACIGHDWGAQLCFELGRVKGPALVPAVVGLTIPYIPVAGPFVPVAALVRAAPKLAYQVYFNTLPARAAYELDASPLRTLRATLRSVASAPPDTFLTSVTSFLDAYDADGGPAALNTDPDGIPPIPFLSPREEEYWAERYAMQGFGRTIYFYRDEVRRRAWEVVQERAAAAAGEESSEGEAGGEEGDRESHDPALRVHQPALSVLATEDPVADWAIVARLLRSSEFVVRGDVETVAGAHWIQLERPEEVNEILVRWLGRHYPAATNDGDRDGDGGVKEEEKAAHDEL